MASHLDQDTHGAALVDLQDLSVLGPQEDVTVSQRDGSDGRVVLQKQACRQEGGGHVGVVPVDDVIGGRRDLWRMGTTQLS